MAERNILKLESMHWPVQQQQKDQKTTEGN